MPQMRMQEISILSSDSNLNISKHNLSMQSLPKNKSISVGNDYQVPVASADLCNEIKPAEEGYPDKDQCIWRWENKLKDDAKIEQYCRYAFVTFGINMERALLILYCSDYDLEVAKAKLARRVDFEEHFSIEDSYIFRNAYNCFGKHFNKIHQMMPHKSIYALVEHYYKTKKKQQYKSSYDVDAALLDETSDEELDGVDKKKDLLHDPVCENCKNTVKKVFLVNGLEVCRTCKLYFKSTNRHRICKKVDPPRRRTFCPNDMESIAQQFQDLAQSATDQAAANFENADDSGDLQIAKPKVTKCKKTIRETEETYDQTRAKARQLEISVMREFKKSKDESDVVSQVRSFLASTETHPPNPNGIKKPWNSHSWTPREEQAAFHALVRFEGDCQLVAEILGTKTQDMVKAFYAKYQKVIQQKIDQWKEEDAKCDFDVEKELKKIESKRAEDIIIDLE